MQKLFEIIKEERSEQNHRELPCRDFDWDCLAIDGVIPFGSYLKCQWYDRERGKCLFVRND